MQPSRPARALVVALLPAFLLAGFAGFAAFTATEAVAAAPTANRTVQGGRLDWGIKSSFQSYVTGPVANGSWSLTGGAATVGGSQFRFHSAKGTYDPDSGAFSAAFSGGVHFLGHRETNGDHQLDLSIGNPSVRISGGSATLYADMVSKELGTGKVTTSTQVPFAALSLSGIDMRGGGSPVALNNLPATLTSQGATAFAGYYTAGTALDPVSLSADVLTPAETRKPTATATATPGSSPTASGSSAPADHAFTDAAVDWGVRRTYREYVTGETAKGSWTLTDGAEDGGALFRFGAGKGTYDPEKRTLDATFGGTVRFTGTGTGTGLDPDLTLRAFAVTVKDGKGTLYADVTDTGTTSKHVALVTFAADALKTATRPGTLVTLTEAPAQLTADGAAKAFGGMYQAGTAMDPVSLAVALDDKAVLPALPDLGSGSTATPSPTPSTTATPTAAAPSAESKDVRAEPAASSSYAVPLAAGGAGLLLAAGAAFLVVRRKRRTATAVPPASD
jgi:hypothetical protein